MESTLHRQLKAIYAAPADQIEAKVDRYRVDILADGRVVEIQQAGLGALRDKVRRLLKSHAVTVVKPIAAVKRIVTCSSQGQVVRRRRSPKRGSPLNLFDDLIHFATVFPHPQLTLEVALVEIEEWRTPPKRRWSRRGYHVADRKLLQVNRRLALRNARDLLHLMPVKLPSRFDTKSLAERISIPRWRAQQIAYCLRHCGTVQTDGRKRNAWQYRLARPVTPNLARVEQPIPDPIADVV